MSNLQEGPQEKTVIVYSCHGCYWWKVVSNSSSMLCSHPKMNRTNSSTWLGEYIGAGADRDKTPAWCPLFSKGDRA